MAAEIGLGRSVSLSVGLCWCFDWLVLGGLMDGLIDYWIILKEKKMGNFSFLRNELFDIRMFSLVRKP